MPRDSLGFWMAVALATFGGLSLVGWVVPAAGGLPVFVRVTRGQASANV